MKNQHKSHMPLDELLLQKDYEGILSVIPMKFRLEIEKRLVKEFNKSIDELFDDNSK